MRKSFTSLEPVAGAEFDVNGVVFHLRPSIPGEVLLDFLAGADDENPASLAKTVRALIEAAVIPEDYERFQAFVRNPDNNVTLGMLSEIAGFMAESLSGNDPEKQRQPSTAG